MHVLSGDKSFIDVVGDVDGFVGVVACSLSMCGKYVPAARTTETCTLNVKIESSLMVRSSVIVILNCLVTEPLN